MFWKPSDKLIRLFADELLDCSGPELCEVCYKEAQDALMYAAELALNDALDLEEELANRIHTFTTADFEIALNMLRSNAIWFGLTTKPKNREYTQQRITEAEEKLRSLFYSRKQK